MLQQTQTHHQTLLNNGRRSNSIEAVREALQHRETLPAGQVPLLFVPATAEEQVNDATKEAAKAAETAAAAAAKTAELKNKLAALKAKKEAATKRNANTRTAENAQRAAAAAVKAAEEAVKAAGETEARTVKVACGKLSDAVVDLQQLFGRAAPEPPARRDAPPPTESVPLNLKGTLRLAADMAHSAATLEELDVRCPPPKFPPLPNLGLKLWNPFGSRTATAAPPPPPPGGPGFTFADLLPEWPGSRDPPHVPQRAVPPQADMLLAAAAPPMPPTKGAPASLRLRLRTAHGFHKGDQNSVAAAAGNKRGNILKPANNSLHGEKGTKTVGNVAKGVMARRGGTRRTRRTRHRGTRRH